MRARYASAIYNADAGERTLASKVGSHLLYAQLDGLIIPRARACALLLLCEWIRAGYNSVARAHARGDATPLLAPVRSA